MLRIFPEGPAPARPNVDSLVVVRAGDRTQRNFTAVRAGKDNLAGAPSPLRVPAGAPGFYYIGTTTLPEGEKYETPSGFFECYLYRNVGASANKKADRLPRPNIFDPRLPHSIP